MADTSTAEICPQSRSAMKARLSDCPCCPEYVLKLSVFLCRQRPERACGARIEPRSPCRRGFDPCPRPRTGNHPNETWRRRGGCGRAPRSRNRRACDTCLPGPPTCMVDRKLDGLWLSARAAAAPGLPFVRPLLQPRFARGDPAQFPTIANTPFKTISRSKARISIMSCSVSANPRPTEPGAYRRASGTASRSRRIRRHKRSQGSR